MPDNPQVTIAIVSTVAIIAGVVWELTKGKRNK